MNVFAPKEIGELDIGHTNDITHSYGLGRYFTSLVGDKGYLIAAYGVGVVIGAIVSTLYRRRYLEK